MHRPLFITDVELVRLLVELEDGRPAMNGQTESGCHIRKERDGADAERANVRTRTCRQRQGGQ